MVHLRGVRCTEQCTQLLPSKLETVSASVTEHLLTGPHSPSCTRSATGRCMTIAANPARPEYLLLGVNNPVVRVYDRRSVPLRVLYIHESWVGIRSSKWACYLRRMMTLQRRSATRALYYDSPFQLFCPDITQTFPFEYSAGVSSHMHAFPSTSSVHVLTSTSCVHRCTAGRPTH